MNRLNMWKRSNTWGRH